MRVLSISNQKGGVGKSTTSLSLAAIMAGAGQRVLLCDLDPQSSLSQMIGVEAEGRSLAEVLGTNRPGSLAMVDILREIRPGLTLAPADLALSRTESGLMLRYGREYVLRDALATVADRFDYCLIDSPPSLGILLVDALACSDGVVIPTLAASADIRGVKIFLDNLEELKPINPKLDIVGVVVTRYRQNTNSQRQALAAVQRSGLRVLGVVPESIRVQESQTKKIPISEYDPSGPVSEAYRAIANEVTQWQRNSQPRTITTNY